MKKSVTWMMLLAFVWLIIPGNLIMIYAQEKSTTIAVLGIDAKGGVSPAGAATLADRLRSELVNLKVFTVLERGQMDAILNEQGFNMSGCTSSECVVEAGRLLGVQQMVAGDVGKVGNVLTIDLRVFDVTTGEIVRADQFDYEGDVAGLLQVMKQAAYQIAGLEIEEAGGFPWFWVGLGAVAVGVGAVVALSGSSDSSGDTGTTPTSALPNPSWPPE
jgi:TolB-like protein